MVAGAALVSIVFGLTVIDRARGAFGFAGRVVVDVVDQGGTGVTIAPGGSTEGTGLPVVVVDTGPLLRVVEVVTRPP